MAQQTINVGTSPNDGTGTPLRTAFQYTNSNFTELYTAVGPSGNNIVVPGTATITGAANFNGGALAGYLNGNLMFGSSGNIVNFFAQANGFAFKENTGANNLLTISNAGVFGFLDGAGGTRMTLNSTGLGVGKSPAYRLDIAGIGNFEQLRVSNSAATSIGIVNTTSGLTYTLFSANAASNGFNGFGLFDGSSYVLRIDSSGNVGVGVTPSGTGGCLQLKSGITFPATQVASSDANTLDDYEEGTWTGTLKGSVSDPTTPVTATGRYTKIGRQVYVQINFANVNTTGASGEVQISGLPFANNGSVVSQGTIVSDQTLTFTGSPYCWVDLSGTTVRHFSFVSNGAASPATHNAGVARYLYSNLTYTVA